MSILVQCRFDGLSIPKNSRPTITDAKIKRIVCSKLAPSLVKIESPNVDSRKIKSVVNDLMKIINIDKSSYDLSKELYSKRKYYVDSSLYEKEHNMFSIMISKYMEIFNKLKSVYTRIYDETVFNWILKYDIKASHKVGELIKIYRSGECIQCVINSIDRKHAIYNLVSIGLNFEDSDFITYEVNFEDIQ